MAFGIGYAAGNAISALGNIANAQNSDSKSWNTGSSYGSYGGSAYGFSDSTSALSHYAKTDSRSASNSTEDSITYGREASAQDVENAYQNYLYNRQLWQDQANYNAQQADIDRQFQAYMSNTAYQRAVADLLAAGLNPILAVGNMGASTPSGAMASTGLASTAKANAYAQSESHGESSSWSWYKSKEKTKQKSSSHSEEGSSYGGSNSSVEEGGSNSKTRTQLKDVIDAISNLFANENSGKTVNRAQNGKNNKGGGQAGFGKPKKK